MSELQKDAAPAVAPTDITLARLTDAGEFAVHIVDHVAHSGADGMPHFAVTNKMSRDDIHNRAIERWSKALNEPLWGRAWLLWSQKPKRIVGHLELIGGRVPAEFHRATLGMGMLREFTGRGNGRRLMETAFEWARSEAHLAWIDLGVFSENWPARKLYERMGFQLLGIRKDAFRIGDHRIDDIHMYLKL